MRAFFATTIAVAHLFNLSPMILHRIFYLESGYGEVLESSTGCCFGPGHVNAKEWGVSQELLLEPGPSVICSAQIFRFMLDRYDGDTRKAVAAYTAGHGTIDRLTTKYGASWFKYLEPRYQKYVNFVLQRPTGGALRRVVYY